MIHTHKSSRFRLLCGILLSVALQLTGCLAQPDQASLADEIEETEAVYFESIGQGSTASFNTVMEQVVYDEEGWNGYKMQMETVLPFREVDFSQLMVVFVAIPRTSGGVTVQIESIELAGGELIVGYLLGEPGRDCRVIDTPSVPFQAVYLRRIEGMPVRFERRSELQPCTLR